MKKILIKVILLIVFTSCADRLDLAPISESSIENFYKTPDDMEQAVIAAYDALQMTGQYGRNFMFFMEIRSDNATVESPTNSGGVFGEFDLFSITPGNSVIETTWNDCYAGIQRCNIVLNRIDGITMDESIKSVRTGEVKFIRALTYFNLVRLWGDVPLVTHEISDPFEAFSIGRTSSGQVYEQIVQDLKDAVAALPPSQNEAGRVTRDAALTLLGKVYLTLEDYDRAVSELRKVVTSGYKLLENYEDNFGPSNENGEESIFEVQFTGGFGSATNGGEGSPYPNLVAPVGTAGALLGGIGETKGENIPTNDLYNSYEVGDLRRAVTIGEGGDAPFHAKKLITVPVAEYDSDLNVIVLRYADVLLMLAEALNELGYQPDGEAFDLMNKIRDRAGLAYYTATTVPDQSSFRDALLKERRHEFVSENHRWFDLLRFGKAVEIMNASTAAFTVNDFQRLYPIPLSAIDAMNDPSIFYQNPGY